MTDTLWAQGSMPQLSRPWQRKMESSPRLGLGTMFDLLGQSLTCMGLHARLLVWSLGTAWEGVKYPRPLNFWAGHHYMLLGHI